MKYEGEVSQLKSVGNEAEVEVVNVKRKGQAGWRENGINIKFRIPFSMSKSFFLERPVVINIQPK